MNNDDKEFFRRIKNKEPIYMDFSLPAPDKSKQVLVKLKGIASKVPTKPVIKRNK